MIHLQHINIWCIGSVDWYDMYIFYNIGYGAYLWVYIRVTIYLISVIYPSYDIFNNLYTNNYVFSFQNYAPAPSSTFAPCTIHTSVYETSTASWTLWITWKHHCSAGVTTPSQLLGSWVLNPVIRTRCSTYLYCNTHEIYLYFLA